MTIQYQQPVRNNVLQNLVYTFKDEANATIDLTAYISCSAEAKLQGAAYASVAADFFTPRTSGQVQVDAYAFVGPGIWDIQFVCVDDSGNKLYGEPIQITVVKNVDDLSVGELPPY